MRMNNPVAPEGLKRVGTGVEMLDIKPGDVV
jgi:hypothetical protein